MGIRRDQILFVARNKGEPEYQQKTKKELSNKEDNTLKAGMSQKCLRSQPRRRIHQVKKQTIDFKWRIFKKGVGKWCFPQKEMLNKDRETSEEP